MFGLFRKNAAKTPQKPKAIAFVDFEHWYISLDKMHHLRPDIKAWRDELSERFDMKEIIFFADFSNQSLRSEIPKIREITNYIIETQNASSNYKKDFTDFIMLDHIYQNAMNSDDIDTFVLFSGDGHFNSVVNFLTSRLKKKVLVYGIRDAMSNQLRNSATWCITLPKNNDPDLEIYKMILRNMKYLKDKNSSSNGKYYPTFWPTVEMVSRLNKLKKKDVAEALRKMISKGYIIQLSEKLPDGKVIKYLSVKWNKCESDGITAD